MLCPKCEAFVVESTEVCWSCGLPLHEKSDTIKSNVFDNEDKEEEPFYRKNFFVWIMFLTFPIVGVFIMWRYGKFSLQIRVMVTLIWVMSAYYTYREFNRSELPF